jgi:phosphonate transport system substrate-binding protein
MKKTGMLFLICMLLFASTAFCAQQKWPSKIKVGLIPTEGGADIVKRFKPLMEHLENQLGIEVEGISAADYAGLITAMANKHLDFAYFGPKSYIEAADRAGAEALVLELDSSRQPGYHGIVITKKDSGIKSMEDAKGKLFAFTDPNSTSGCLVPNILFARDMKVKPENYFKEIKFSGSHGASILGVKNKTIEVAATNNIDLDRMIEKGAVSKDDFNILWTSDLIPGAPMCARKDLPSSLKEAFRGAVLSFNANKQGIMKLQNGGYQYADDSVYDVVRYMNRLKKQLAGE